MSADKLEHLYVVSRESEGLGGVNEFARASEADAHRALRERGYLVVPTPWPGWALRQLDVVELERLYAAAAIEGVPE